MRGAGPRGVERLHGAGKSYRVRHEPGLATELELDEPRVSRAAVVRSRGEERRHARVLNY